LYLVPKPHPESKHPQAEWRLSFSIGEREIMLRLPEYHRKVFVWLKSYFKNHHRKNHHESWKKFESFHLKTVLLWHLDDETNMNLNTVTCIPSIVFNLIQRLTEAFDKKFLPNYFMPKLNLLADKTDECCQELKQDFESMVVNIFAHFIQKFGVCNIEQVQNSEEDINFLPHHVMMLFNEFVNSCISYSESPTPAYATLGIRSRRQLQITLAQLAETYSLATGKHFRNVFTKSDMLLNKIEKIWFHETWSMQVDVAVEDEKTGLVNINKSRKNVERFLKSDVEYQELREFVQSIASYLRSRGFDLEFTHTTLDQIENRNFLLISNERSWKLDLDDIIESLVKNVVDYYVNKHTERNDLRNF